MTGKSALAGGVGVFVALFGAAIAWSTSAQEHQKTENPHATILSVGGTVTEIVYALDQGHRLLARDTTSTFPDAATDLPDVGYMRALSPEGVLSTGATLILAEEGAGPQETLDVIRAADVEFVSVPLGFDTKAIVQKITLVGDALGVPDKAKALSDTVTQTLESAVANSQAQTPKRVMFLLNAGEGKLMVAGSNTAADAIIKLAGGVNAINGLTGYKPFTDEAAAAAAPDVILMMARGHAMTAQDLFSLPALAITPAAQEQALVTMDGLKLLGFGPRTAQAITELNQALYQD